MTCSSLVVEEAHVDVLVFGVGASSCGTEGQLRKELKPLDTLLLLTFPDRQEDL